MNLIIRECRSGDWGGVVEVARQSGEPGEGLVIVAEDSEVPGLIVGYLVHQCLPRRRVIETIGVLADCRLQGIGRELVQYVKDLLYEHGLDSIDVLVPSHGAELFFQRCGFRFVEAVGVAPLYRWPKQASECGFESRSQDLRMD